MKDNAITLLLSAALIAALLLRLAFPFYWNPLDHLWSDTMRHWNNATLYHQLNFFGGMDPKAYQWFLASVYDQWQGAREPTTWAVGVLSSLTGLFWYFTARELLPPRAALVVGIALCLCPATLIVFGYFMNETILLTTLGFAWWTSFVCWRKRSLLWFALAVAGWWLAIHSRVIALPLAVGMVGFLWWILPRKITHLTLIAVISALMIYPAARFSYERIGVFTPFSYGALNKIYLRTKDETIEFTTNHGYLYGFSSFSFYSYPLAPFSDYQLTRAPKAHRFHVDTNKGTEDWDNELRKVSRHYHLQDYAADVKDNIIHLLFAPAWPEYSANPADGWLLATGFWQRWMWAPLMLCAFWAALFLRLPPRQALFLAATIGLLLVLSLQNEVIMEGRYRKPTEPMLIIVAAFIALYRRHPAPEGKTLWGHTYFCVAQTAQPSEKPNNTITPPK